MSDNDLYRSLGNIEAKLNILLDRHDGFDKRITKLEHAWVKVTGIVLAITAIFGILFP
jgi:uncharacterized protein YdcH (DUF465 family)